MTGQAAIVIGASGGIGSALVGELRSRGGFDTLWALSRQSDPPIDLTDEASIANAAAVVAQSGVAPTLIIVTTGILHRDGRGPEKGLRDLDADWMIENYRLNAVGPALVAKHFLPLMPKRGRSCFAILSARVGSISDNSLGGWHSYRASKAALNMLIRNASIEWQRKNPDAVIFGLHPGTVETPLSAPFKGNPAHQRRSPADVAAMLLNVLDRLNPAESGRVFAYDGTAIAP